MIALDENGNFKTDSKNRLVKSARPDVQNFESETRCMQTTWEADENFGKNILVWTLAQSITDRATDLVRIGSKYLTVLSVSYNSTTKRYDVKC